MAIGAIAALLSSRLLASLLFGVKATPTSASLVPWVTTNRSTSSRWAPRAMRIPNSRVRVRTANATMYVSDGRKRESLSTIEHPAFEDPLRSGTF